MITVWNHVSGEGSSEGGKSWTHTYARTVRMTYSDRIWNGNKSREEAGCLSRPRPKTKRASGAKIWNSLYTLRPSDMWQNYQIWQANTWQRGEVFYGSMVSPCMDGSAVVRKWPSIVCVLAPVILTWLLRLWFSEMGSSKCWNPHQFPARW